MAAPLSGASSTPPRGRPSDGHLEDKKIACLVVEDDAFQMAAISQLIGKAETAAGLDVSLIESCVNDPDKSAALQKKFFGLTPSDHKYTPWVVVDGTLSPSNGQKLLEEVCAAYTGEKPPGCSGKTEKKVCLNERA